MLKAIGVLNKNFVTGEVSGNLFGGFLEHMGRVIYGGLYEPSHPEADEEGFRKDVLELVKGLSMPLMRYPGGNFVSAYDWRTGIGPVEQRKAHFDPAWGEWEKNEFALDEFLSWCRKADTQPALALNLGTGTMEMALALFDYCNGNEDCFWGKKRMEYTSEPPRNIRYFFLGNEMSSPRQPGHKKAEDYALLAANIAKKFKEKDPLCQLILSGSSCRNAATYGYWDDTILEIAYDHIDFISLHAYFGPVKEDPDAFRCSDLLLDRHIEEVIAMCDAVAARKKTAKKLFLSLDEWNIWSGTNIPIVPQIKDFEDEYTALDAVVMGGLLMSILSHCHRLKIACLAQCCNILAPVMTREGGGAWKQTIYAPFALTSRYGRGKVLQNSFSCPEITLPQSGKKYPAQRLTCVYEEKEKRLSLFLLNRSIIEHGVFEVLLENFEPETIEETFLISPEDPMAVNRENEENLKVKKIEKYSLEGKKVSVELPAGAWGLVLVKLK